MVSKFNDDAASISTRLARAAPIQEAALSDLQRWMTELIGHRRAIPTHLGLEAAARLHFTGNDRLSPAEQIDIYRVQFWLRHTGVLIDHFQGLSRWLGQERWQPIAEGYLTHPKSAVFALADLGHQLAQYIEDLPPFADQRLCVDMARLEWAYQRAFSAFDDPPLSLEKLRDIPAEAWSHARFSIADSVQLLELNYPAADLRRQLLDEQRLDQSVVDHPSPIKMVVYRRQLVIYDKQISNVAFALLNKLQANMALIPACEAVMEAEPHAEELFEQQLMHWFQLWGRLGWIVDVHTEP